MIVGLLVVGLVTTACTNDADPETIEREPTPTDPVETTDDPETDPPSTAPAPTEPGDVDEPDEPDEPDAIDDGDLTWSLCDDEFDAALRCATLPVPLDHDDPDGETIELALIRLAASGTRQGAVLVNPGGPGGSGVDFVGAIATYAVGEMRLDDFDLVGFDPRGVDRSNGLRCLDDDEFDALLFERIDDPDGTDDESDESDEGDEGSITPGVDDERLAEACRAEFGDTLQHYSTEATARDMDLIREAMDDDSLSYIGISYGTYLGAVYATLFPERVRAMVLDSAFEPTGDTVEQQYLTQLVGFEEAFTAWADDCQADLSCNFGGDDVAGSWDALRAQLDASPLANDDGRAGDASVLETATIAALYDPLTWAMLASALDDAFAGDPAGLFGLTDLYVGRSPDGTYSTIQQSNTVISCASGFGRTRPDDPDALAELIRTSAPRWGADVDEDSFTDRCADLVPEVDLPDLTFTGDAPIVVIGGVNDPATPFRWSVEMADTLGPTATLVTWSGEGHGQLFGSSCLLDVAASVLVDVEPPADGTECQPDPPVERPDFWDDIPVPDGIDPEPLPAEAMVLLGLPPRLVYGEARTSSLDADGVLDVYDAALTEIGFQSFGAEEPLPGLVVATYASPTFEIVSVLVLSDEAFDDPELAPAARLVDDDQVLLAVITFPS